MKVWAVVPMKPLKLAKRRLADVLDPHEREKLAEDMLRHVLDVLCQSGGIDRTLVVSRDPRVASIAREYTGVQTLQEGDITELNTALARASLILKAWGATGVLVLPGDLPLLTVDDVDRIVSLGSEWASVVIAPDRHREGTNALLLTPPELASQGESGAEIFFTFGEGSFQRHVERARELGTKVHIYESDTIALDLDLPEDLELYRRMSEERRQPETI